MFAEAQHIIPLVLFGVNAIFKLKTYRGKSDTSLSYVLPDTELFYTFLTELRTVLFQTCTFDAR